MNIYESCSTCGKYKKPCDGKRPTATILKYCMEWEKIENRIERIIASKRVALLNGE